MVGSAEPNSAEGDYEEVEEGIYPTSRYSSYKERRKSRFWGIEETRLFYRVRVVSTLISNQKYWFIYMTFYKLHHISLKPYLLLKSTIDKLLP